MKVEVAMPKMGFSEADVTLTQWLKNEGDAVVQGEPIAELEGEKIVNNLESPVSGTLAKQCIEEGTEAQIGTVVAIIEADE
ncbi:MAG: lipoyl domain-containing protein [Eubacterium sp.]|nr:lipoyl domain-containing protein [Eubacterium sp.]